ncbi:unnamed protein product [Owenia fusiformis]|uniref:Uncharacterized protein n=1 Tax=Owenia fusiformis TaxID=6347 RepID=A0A8J1TVR5_OWEFU|nr:unnamed protein product [Owenia fusiformis]
MLASVMSRLGINDTLILAFKNIQRTSVSVGFVCDKKVVEVCVKIVKIGEIDTLHEQYTAEVLVKAKWREPALDFVQDAKGVDLGNYWHPKLYIANTIGTPSVAETNTFTIDKNHEAYMRLERRTRGMFMETLELREFPFDIQDLAVTVVSDRIEEVQIIQDRDEYSSVYRSDFADAQEWYLYSNVDVEETIAPYGHRTRSALVVKMKAARRPKYFIWNNFFVTFVITALSFSTFAVIPKLVQNRLQLSFTLLLTCVAYKFAVSQNLPKIPYLTYLDRYVLFGITTLALICVWHALVTLFLEHPKVALMDMIVLITLASIFVLFNVTFAIYIYATFKRRQRSAAPQKPHGYVQYTDAENAPVSPPAMEKREEHTHL